jgi:hypothetical protein
MGEGVVLLDENLESFSNLGIEKDRDLKLNRLSGAGEIVLDSRIDGVNYLTKPGRQEFVGGCSTSDRISMSLFFTAGPLWHALIEQFLNYLFQDDASSRDGHYSHL